MEVLAYQYAALFYETSVEPKSVNTYLVYWCIKLHLPGFSQAASTQLLCMTLALVLGLAHSAMALLSKGNRGPAVTSLQLNLQNAGYDPGPIDGVFGGATEYAVRRFQSDRGLSIDGVVGPSTEAALTGATSTARRPQSNSSSQRTIELQQLLANRSCYQGPIDGIYGPATSAAVLRAQRVYGLVVDGIAGPATIAALQASRCNCS